MGLGFCVLELHMYKLPQNGPSNARKKFPLILQGEFLKLKKILLNYLGGPRSLLRHLLALASDLPQIELYLGEVCTRVCVESDDLKPMWSGIKIQTPWGRDK